MSHLYKAKVFDLRKDTSKNVSCIHGNDIQLSVCLNASHIFLKQNVHNTEGDYSQPCNF